MDIEEYRQQSYVPYSKKSSVAFVCSKTGSVFPGTRVENISYPLSISAPQNALFCCLSEGEQPEKLFSDNEEAGMISCWKKEFQLAIYPLDEISLSDNAIEVPVLDQDIDVEQKLTELLDLAVVDESDFPVSALLETERGFFSGVNVECTAWNMGLCAERIAIAKALTFGSKKLKRLHIHTRKGEFSSPCGACRQVIIEHLPNRKIHLHHADHSESIHFSNDLLPHSFSSSSLLNS